MTTAPDGYFALDRTKPFKNLEGYVIDADMNVYSVKRPGKPYLMTYTNDAFKLPISAKSAGGTCFVTKELIKEVCSYSTEFQAWKQMTPSGIWSSQAMPEQKVGDYPLAPTSGWIIGTMGSKGLEFSSAPVVHSSLSSVRIECARIAKLVPGTQVVYLEIKGSCQSSGVTWA